MKSKNRLESKSFYFSILEELKIDTNLKRIRDKLNISKQKLNYYLRRLKKEGFVYNKGYGWWELTPKSKNPTKYGIFQSKDSIRGHAYIWEVKIPKEIKGWDKRIQILKKKGINYKLVGAKSTTPRIKALGRKVWLCNNHLRIFDTEKASYYGINAFESRKNATLELIRVIRVIENKLGINLNNLQFKFKKEHYALIKNDLAIDQNKKGIIMRISDEKGEWLLIDDSLEQGGELENVGKKAFQTNIPMQKWWNDMKKHKFEVTPSFILETMQGIQKNQLIFDANMSSHLEVLENIGKAIIELKEEIKKR